MLSLCMIIKNGEKTLPRLLESIHNCFDEYIFVDTGSSDNTVQMLKTWTKESPKKVYIHTFDWIDDFAAARNFSFSKASGDWIMYLDADDELINGEQIRAEVEAVEEHYPDVNAITFPYIYMENDTEQDVLRIIRAKDGWSWEDEIHEHLVCPLGRKRAVITGVEVKHHKDFTEGLHAVDRNARIALKAYNNTTSPSKKARMAAYLATDAVVRGDNDTAARFFRETINFYNGNAFAMFAAYEDYLRMEIQRKNFDSALSLASEMAGRHPEYQEGPLALCAVLSLLGQHGRAVMAFEEAQRKSEPETRVLENVWWTKGICVVHAARSYLALGAVEKAITTLALIPEGVQRHAAVQRDYIGVRSQATVKFGEQLAHRYVDFLLWTCQPTLAQSVLENLPEVFDYSQSLHMKKMEINKRLEHLESDEAYMQAYAAIPAETYHTASHHRELVLNLARVRELLKHVEVHEIKQMLSVGFQDGIIEQAVLATDGELHLTVCDVAPQASQGFEELQKKFPGRVTRYVMEYPMDFPNSQFDLVTAFEVIEHVRDERQFVFELGKRVAGLGTLMLSTPVSARWIENHLSEFAQVKHPYWHVRAFTHITLQRLLFEEVEDPLVNVLEAEDNTYVVSAKPGFGYPENTFPLIQIYVPGTPQPFDAESPERGFLGGSEEAVVRLSQALRDQGFQVVVYAPMPKRADGCKKRVVDNVIWCDPEEFIPQEDAVVLYWRCPFALQSALVQSVRHTKVLWLHDVWYGAPASVYNMADHTLVLSDAHAKSLVKHDGEVKNMRKFANGVVPESFKVFDNSMRKDKRVIYASSPERGLEYLLDNWDEVLNDVPEAELHIYYDWRAFKDGMPADYERMKAKLDVAGPSVIYHGGVSQPELHDAFREASVWAYPNEGEVETFCITAIKAQACGCWPVATDAGALREVISHEVPLMGVSLLHTPDDYFVSMLIDKLKNPPTVEERLMLRKHVIEHFSWEKAVDRLIQILDI